MSQIAYSVESPINSSSLCQQAVDLLRRRIDGQVLLPGQRLDEVALAAELGISRTPLREALKILSTEGLIDLRPRRGCYVTELTLQDLEEIFPIMAMLEGRVACEVACRATAADLRRLDALHDKLEQHASRGDIDLYYETNYAFHSALQEMAGSRWLQSIVTDLRKMLKLSRHRSLLQAGRLGASLAEHRTLMAALRQHDGEKARQVMNGHLMAQLDALQAMVALDEGLPDE
jgi:DNA-binding GntR family transcriptional regulator